MSEWVVGQGAEDMRAWMRCCARCSGWEWDIKVIVLVRLCSWTKGMGLIGHGKSQYTARKPMRNEM